MERLGPSWESWGWFGGPDLIGVFSFKIILIVQKRLGESEADLEPS